MVVYCNKCLDCLNLAINLHFRKNPGLSWIAHHVLFLQDCPTIRFIIQRYPFCPYNWNAMWYSEVGSEFFSAMYVDIILRLFNTHILSAKCSSYVAVNVERSRLLPLGICSPRWIQWYITLQMCAACVLFAWLVWVDETNFFFAPWGTPSDQYVHFLVSPLLLMCGSFPIDPKIQGAFTPALLAPRTRRSTTTTCAPQIHC